MGTERDVKPANVSVELAPEQRRELALLVSYEIGVTDKAARKDFWRGVLKQLQEPPAAGGSPWPGRRIDEPMDGGA